MEKLEKTCERYITKDNVEKCLSFGVERMNSSIFVVSFVSGLSKKCWLNTLGIWWCACELLSVVQARRYK